jgi:redox-sensitive bicupin YhaK (pirin superfamily)
MTIQKILTPKVHDLGGGMLVRRLLPALGQQGIGPFLFFDHFGPIQVTPDANHDVRPHPHIGLSTVSYLFEGAIMHRDSLGIAQRIEPGAINWMTAGRGIVHSERRPEDLRGRAYVNHGLQLWAALPLQAEATEPAFSHTPADAIPEVDLGGCRVRVLIGSAFGRTSPVATFTETLYLDVRTDAASRLTLPASTLQRAVYPVDVALTIGTTAVEPHTMAVLEPGTAVEIGTGGAARYVVIGGEPIDGHRHMWWNFAASSKERLEAAKAAWLADALGRIEGDDERIPLPG